MNILHSNYWLDRPSTKPTLTAEPIEDGKYINFLLDKDLPQWERKHATDGQSGISVTPERAMIWAATVFQMSAKYVNLSDLKPVEIPENFGPED